MFQRLAGLELKDIEAVAQRVSYSVDDSKHVISMNKVSDNIDLR